LWHRGQDAHQIARQLKVTRREVRDIFQPRHQSGACRLCVDSFVKATARLEYQHCHHYGRTIRMDGDRVKPSRLTQDEFRAAIRLSAPKQTLTLPAWNRGRTEFRYKRALFDRKAPRELAHDADQIMRGYSETREPRNTP
jgi:hypothetical protein